MKLIDMPQKFSIPTAVIALGVVVVGATASGQTTTSSTTTSTTAITPSTAIRRPAPSAATDQMIQEACQRQKARTAKAQATGKREQFGSEEPFVFDPTAPPC